jgi:hypothetical protein
MTATAPAGTYYVRVRADNACGSGPRSNEAVVSVNSGTAPPSADWLPLINEWRARAGVSPVSEARLEHWCIPAQQVRRSHRSRLSIHRAVANEPLLRSGRERRRQQ